MTDIRTTGNKIASLMTRSSRVLTGLFLLMLAGTIILGIPALIIYVIGHFVAKYW